jgi:hypothetical protein
MHTILNKTYLILIVLLWATSCEAAQNNAVLDKPKSKQTITETKSPKDSILKNKFLLDSLIASHAFIKKIAEDKHCAVQIIYTQIDRNSKNEPQFTNYTYHLDSSKYFYAASLVKLPASILTLQKLNEINKSNPIPINIKTTMLTNASGSCQKNTYEDKLSFNQLPNLDSYIRRMLLVSDDDAFSRTYEFLTSDYIHKHLKDYGFPNIRIWHRFDPACKGQDNFKFNPITFKSEDKKLLYEQKSSDSKLKLEHPFGKITYGLSNYVGENLMQNPKNFTTMNFMSLQNTHDILKNMMFHEYLPKEKQFKISQTQIDNLRKLLAMYPTEAKYPNYQLPDYFDAYTKYLLYGNLPEAKINPNLRIFNKVGFSYGWVSDIAYFCDFENQTEFMLSAVIYANKDDIMGDGNYEYKTIAYPFMKQLGEVIYNYELKRKNNFIPQLNYLKQDFNERD